MVAFGLLEIGWATVWVVICSFGAEIGFALVESIIGRSLDLGEIGLAQIVGKFVAFSCRNWFGRDYLEIVAF